MNLKIVKFNKVVWILTFMFVLSCSLEQSTTYFPLKAGLEWRYQVTKTTGDGVSQQKYIYISVDDRVINGQAVSVRKSVDGSLFYYRETEDGLLYVGKEIQTGVTREFYRDEHTILQYPFNESKQWQDITTTKLLIKSGHPATDFRIETEIPLKVVIDALDETIIVPAGIFHHCIKITKQGSELKDGGFYIGRTIVRVKETSWYARGVGLVKSIRAETAESEVLDDGQLVIELELFES
jgi:hypothetical protein